MSDRNGWLTAVIALSSALLGSTVGGVFGYRGAIDSQGRQAEEQRITDEREIRRSTYLDYLQAANSYHNATVTLVNVVARSPDGSASLDAMGPWLTARSNYQGSVNSLSVYGSRSAWARHEAIAATLPFAVGFVDPDRLAEDLAGFDRNQGNFRLVFNEFLGVMCRELAVTPRDGCQE